MPSAVFSPNPYARPPFHSEWEEKGEIRLDEFGELSLNARLELLNRVQEQVFLKQMPPEDEKQPTRKQVAEVTAWLQEELAAAGEQVGTGLQ